MQEIHVFIMGGQIRVAEDPIAIHSGDPVVWRIHNCEADKVRWSQIEFEDPKATVFRDRRPRGQAAHVPSLTRGTDVSSGHGCIMGEIPRLPAPGAKPYKYKVRGCSGNPNDQNNPGHDTVPELDPEIIFEDP